MIYSPSNRRRRAMAILANARERLGRYNWTKPLGGVPTRVLPTPLAKPKKKKNRIK